VDLTTQSSTSKSTGRFFCGRLKRLVKLFL